MKNYAPWPVEETRDWKLRATQAMKEAADSLARIPRHMLDPGNPNHPNHDIKLFGEDPATFLARQYR